MLYFVYKIHGCTRFHYMNTDITKTTPQYNHLHTIQTLGKTYANGVNQFFKIYDELTYDNIIKFLEDAKQTKSIATVALYKSSLKKYIAIQIKDLNKLAILDKAFKEIKIKQTRTSIDESKIISMEVIEKMIQRANEKDGLLIKLLSCTGLRVSELCNIKLSDVKRVSIQDTEVCQVRIVGKGGKQRFITLSLELVAKCKEVFNSETYLCETRNHTKYITTDVYLIVRKAGQRVLGTKQVTPHVLRHSFATRMLTSGGQQLKSVSKYLGHSSTAITSDFYIHTQIDTGVLLSEM